MERELEDTVCEISEKAYLAAWMLGIEFELWDCVRTRRRRLGQILVDESSIRRLRELSAALDAWIVFPTPEQPPAFIAFATWEPFYVRWKAGESMSALLPELTKVAYPNE